MLSVAILAGGRTERMGQVKARMPFLGRPLILGIIERLRPLTDDLFVMTDRPADFPRGSRKSIGTMSRKNTGTGRAGKSIQP